MILSGQYKHVPSRLAPSSSFPSAARAVTPEGKEIPHQGLLDPKESFVPTAAPPMRALSKERKAAIFKTVQATQLQVAQQSAVVVGGGPGGLAAAITLAKLGMKVTVLEARANEAGDKPAHARPHQISLRQDSLEMLKKLGAYGAVIEKSGFVDKEVNIHHDGEDSRVHERRPEGKVQMEVGFLLRPTTLNTDSVSQVRISDIEKALLDEANKLGIDVRAGVQADLKPSANGTSYDVEVRKVEKDTAGGYKPVGEAQSLGTPDLVVVADGAGSPTRAALGIKVIDESAPKNYLGGHVQRGIQAETRKASVTEADGFKRHIMGTGHAKYDQTWVSVAITPEEAALSPKERTQLLADKAQYVMGGPVAPEDIGWGAGQLTTVQNRRAEKNYAGDNVVLLGDAAGTGSVWVGGGLNLALTTHLSALKSLATRVGLKTRPVPALKIYDRTLQWATSVWHKAGAAELGVPQAASGAGPNTLHAKKLAS